MRSKPPDSHEPVSVFDDSRRSSPSRFAGRSCGVRGYGRRGPCVQLGVKLEASTFIRMLSICTLVRVPLTDILDSSPQASIRALALEWRFFLADEFPWGRASNPAGVAPEPLEEFLTPLRVVLPSLQKRSRCPMWKVLIGLFHAGVSTYSRWSERHLPQIELLASNPSENLCPIREGQLQLGDVLIKRGRRGRGCWSRSIESSGSMPPFGGIPLDRLNPTLDIPSEFSRWASIFDHSSGIPDSGTRDRLSNPFGGSACDLSRLSRVHTLAYRGRKGLQRFVFLPVGRVFLGGSRCSTTRNS